MCKGAASAELPHSAQRSCPARFSRVDWGASRDPVHSRCVSLPPGLAIPSPTAGKRSSSSAQGSAWRVELGERFTAGEPRGDCVGLSIPRPWLAPAAALGGVPPEAAAPAPAPAGPPTLLLQAGDELQLLLLVRAVHFGGWGWG